MTTTEAATTNETSTPELTSADGSGADSPTSRWGRAKKRMASVGQTSAGSGSPQWSQPVAVTVLFLLSLSAIWLLVYAVFLSGLQEHSAQHRLYSSIRYSLAEELAPFGGQITPGTPVAVLQIPAAGIDRAVIVEGTTSGVLRDGPGHQQNTPLPGQVGVSVVMGRSVTFGAPFRHVPSLQVGDPITVTTGQGVFHYTVTDVRGNGDPLPPTLGPSASRLTLVTSRGSGWRDGWAPSHPVFVDATMHGKVQAAPSGRPSVIAPDATVMHSDSGGLFALVLWLQALLIVSCAFVWARMKWGYWQAWLAGVPAILAVVWLTSSDLLRLLPNLV
jgi:sortase A